MLMRIGWGRNREKAGLTSSESETKYRGELKRMSAEAAKRQRANPTDHWLTIKMCNIIKSKKDDTFASSFYFMVGVVRLELTRPEATRF